MRMRWYVTILLVDKFDQKQFKEYVCFASSEEARNFVSELNSKIPFDSTDDHLLAMNPVPFI